MTEREALVALNLVSGMGAVTARKLAERLGSFAAVARAGEGELRAVPSVGPERAAFFAAALREADPGAEMERAERLRVRLVTLADPDYPQALKQIADPPFVLYVRGDASVMGRPCVAVIGTRHPSVYGRETARRFGYQLAGAGYTVVSGLASGIDGEAHAGAVRAGGATAGILGGALDRFYPRGNLGLAREMVKGGGAVATEYPFGREPDRQTFPMRNRVVSGLCRGVVVVEAPLASGTMITVGQALDQNRVVMAVPGRVDSPVSKGCHRLIREGARLVTTADEAIEEMQDLVGGAGRAGAGAGGAGAPRRPGPAAAREEGRPAPALSPEERSVYGLLTEEGLSVDAVVRASGLDAGRAGSILVGLQIKRLAKALPGGYVAKT